MSSKDGRLDKLFPGLTAKERAILTIKALKEDRDEDPKVRFTMPQEQAPEFNRYIALFNAVNQDMGFYIILLQQLVEQLDLRYSWFLTVRVWGMRASSVTAYLVLYTKESVTQSEHQRHLKKARERMLPISEAAEVLTERHAWAESDLEEYEGEQEVTDVAWDRVFKDKRKDIIGLVDSGVLAGKRRGRSVRVNAGSFYDWLGEPVPLMVDWGVGYDVFPDDQVEEVERLKKARRSAQATLAKMPSEITFDPELRAVRHKSKGNGEGSWDGISHALQTNLRKGIQMRWWELRAVELVLEEANEELDGEDALGPRLRQRLHDAKYRVQEICDGLEAFGDSLELSEPEEEHIQLTKELMDSARER